MEREARAINLVDRVVVRTDRFVDEQLIRHSKRTLTILAGTGVAGVVLNSFVPDLKVAGGIALASLAVALGLAMSNAARANRE